MTTLQRLRELTPIRPVHLGEALRIAELQAATFLQIHGINDGPVPERLIAELPRLQIERLPLPHGCSALSQWAKGRWVIVINTREPQSRQRFSLAHELKHILDHPYATTLYASQPEQVEAICDHFAACLLMPRPWIKRAWCGGLQDVAKLARAFQVSTAAVQVRLERIGLVHYRYTRHGVLLNQGAAA